MFQSVYVQYVGAVHENMFLCNESRAMFGS